MRPEASSLLCRILPDMRAWACSVALILGLAGNRYAWTVRPRLPVPIERRIELTIVGRTLLTLDWWRR